MVEVQLDGLQEHILGLTITVPLSEDEIKMKTGCLLVSKAIILSNCIGLKKSINIQEIKGDFFKEPMPPQSMQGRDDRSDAFCFCDCSVIFAFSPALNQMI